MLVLVLAGAASANTYLRPVRSPVTGPGPSASPVSLGPGVAAVAVSPSGTMFLASSSCLFGCARPDDRFGDVVWRSTDSGSTWTRLASPQDSYAGTLLAVSDTQLWLVDDVTISAASDGGHNWQSLSLGGDSTASAYAATTGGSVWLVQNGAVAMSQRGANVDLPQAQPPGRADSHGIAVFGEDSAAVLTGHSPATWFVTNDRGAHWAPMADPCHDTLYPGSPYSTMTAAPDGSRWVVCAGAPAAGQQGKQLVTSTDGGRTWQSRGPLEPAGYATRVVPISATVAWRSGPGGEIYRTTDAVHWTPVANTGARPGEVADMFAARDADTAVYLRDTGVYVTHDGGLHWTAHRFPSG
ncbi:hypothetical protein Raf01_27620 [Rugosimonospora africana]|uniref:DUF6242 domain-containing protein n=2 Tax=Rugosimonospora africana TaxID=556532 RepID=A0A8J3VPY4_9ACTN|nr:hypothetical protein Raf01_27620 [Rugosimonospora africana]